MATFLTVPVTVPIEVPPITTVFVERAPTDEVPWTRIGQTDVTGTTGYFYDNTAPFDVEPAPTDDRPCTRIGQTEDAGATGYFDDNTAPFDKPVWYRFAYVSRAVEVFTPHIVGPLTLVGNGTVVLSEPNRPCADIK